MNKDEKLSREYKDFLLAKFHDERFENIVEHLVKLEVDYINFNNEHAIGELVCHEQIVEDLDYIFHELYENKYQIEKIKLIDEYNFNDDASMADNNASCFNFRPIMNTNRLSKHSYGIAVDINPLYNPYVVNNNEEINIYPKEGIKYADREHYNEHYIDHEDLCYKLFIQRGFTWGGDWSSPDYQHFQKDIGEENE